MSALGRTLVCRLQDIEREGGVAALVAGEPVAVFRTYGDEVYALSNLDPFSGASVLARGIVGTVTVGGRAVDFVASPMHKQRFDLSTGECLEDPTVAVAVHDIRLDGDNVFIVPGGLEEAG